MSMDLNRLVQVARVANHLLCVGAHLADLGSLHSLLWLMEERERLMRVTGHLTGSRLHPMWIVPGIVLSVWCVSQNW